MGTRSATACRSIVARGPAGLRRCSPSRVDGDAVGGVGFDAAAGHRAGVGGNWVLAWRIVLGQRHLHRRARAVTQHAGVHSMGSHRIFALPFAHKYRVMPCFEQAGYVLGGVCSQRDQGWPRHRPEAVRIYCHRGVRPRGLTPFGVPHWCGVAANLPALFAAQAEYTNVATSRPSTPENSVPMTKPRK